MNFLALFTISDLHLSFSSDKPMDIFKGWDNYVDRIKANWLRVVSKDDTVVLPGDFSWALKLEDTLADFMFLNELPGQKIILKGNHDLWWCTVSKMNAFFEQNKIDTVRILHNNHFEVENLALCGTRGWMFEGTVEQKVLLREAGRLEASLASAKQSGLQPIVFMHYPPAYDKHVCNEFFDIFEKYGVKDVYYGHMHGRGIHPITSVVRGVNMRLVSCDCIDFNPYRIV